MLTGLAYRILGSRADAEDAVQDTFLKWQSVDQETVRTPIAWLRTACTRRAIDMLRGAHKSRVDYVGAWLPEPIQATMPADEEGAALASSLTTAFLLMLQRLTPKERAAYLLREIFEAPYPEIAQTLELTEQACRKLVSRAQSHIAEAGVRHVTPAARQEELLATFEAAVESGDTSRLAALLSDDIAFRQDTGGKVAAFTHQVDGKEAVLALIRETLHRYWSQCEWRPADINGQRGALLVKDGATIATLAFSYDTQGRATHVYVMRNPEKLAGLGRPGPN